MSGTNPVFLVRKAKKSSGQKDAVLWCSDDFEAANATLDYLLIKSGAKLKDYFKAVATNFPVVNELPPEGELSLTFCDYYQLAKDNMTWTQIPGVTLPSSEAAAAARQHIVDGVDTETGEVLEDHTENFGNESNSPAQATAPAPELTVVATMPLRHRVLAQYIGEGEYLYHVDASQKKEILRLEMDTDNSYVQNLLLAAENVEAFKKAIEHDIHKIVNAVKKVFPVDGKTPELATVIQFLKTWFETEHIDRGLLVKEWAKGNRVSAIQRTESGANAGGGNKTDRNPDYEHTLDTLDVEIAMATLPMDFNIYELPGSVYRRAKEIVKKKESPFKEWSAALRATPGILDYSRAAIFALIRSAPPEFYHYPGRLQGYINANLTETDHENPTEEALTAARHTPEKDAVEEANRQLAAARGEYVEGISDPNDPKWVKTGTSQPTTEPELVKNVGNGIFDVSALMQNSSTHGTETNPEITSNVQVQEADSDEKQAGDAVQAGEGDLGTGKEAVTVEAETHQNNDSVSQSEPEAQQNVPESQQEEPEAAWPEYFEPGRYEGVPNEVYHAANGISSTQVKDARVSLMYFNARHVEKTIVKERSPVLDMGNLVHALALQPENLEAEFSVEPEIPEGAFTTTATLREFIDAHNASLPALLSADDIKALLEKYNATLPSQMPLGASVDETYASYEQLPEEFQRIENGTKHTATAMKACIKEYNATLPAPVKTSGSRDALLEQLAIINPDLVAQEAQKSSPLKVSGTKADLIQAVKSVNPAAVFADELLDAWRENTEGKVLVTRQQLSTALNIQKALLEHPTAGKLLTHPSRAVEVSYFGIDEETGLEVRVRPDLELDMGGLRIGADLKTISMWNIKQEGLRAKLHREIIDRDYHLSAAMYCETAALDQFFWIFVNKDENYHWVAIIEASTELLELGMLEYRKTMREIANGFDTGEWSAPIAEDYTDELNDFDVRRLEALRVQA
ncbi:TPA: PD-(D/E)XK nuclease-like domain-containing protein [Salmonella enterica subsp. enterica serovar Bredeney]|uniref:Exodeoxyribonuclease n=1 Tax=Salmonella enterica subsp. enterica serovar Bredeney TaxID=134047 RepID=A0A3U7ZJN0_SALET|nr:RecE family exodeoxyribonuclease [Salmonella enterica]EHC3816407.1 exodeoxyribonuclease [Salmonella enterica subsp. enterica serovar Telelkebir]HBI5740257.1 PD-(D/E)XK nuclease-like domain-containing protein [Salmonella enterica subsp. enterica serovar Welikade]EAA5613177.1 exodeoxyribonuclease [Salmonella enterica subsp. enterica serovar Bredeney]EAB6287673.1 exodeoxyribonuclease [Salmonella enterica subsp. enterica serovar Bredeney]EAR7346065.1 exodeoxyribonuclease [Salmonella enterica]